MKRLLKFTLGLLIAYLTYRLLTEYLRPMRVSLEDQEFGELSRAVSPPPPYPRSAPTPSGPAAPDKLDLNQADATALATLPGIGPALAERIITHRQQVGPFANLEDLKQVRGVGPALIDRLRPLATVV
jgi:competence ComEA-like helix-hairpin-helix protein